MQFVAGVVTPAETHGLEKMPHTEVQKLVESLDTLQEVRSVNALIQGLCARSVSNDLGGSETQGLMVVLAWQNEKMLAAESVVQNILQAKTALKAV